MVTEVCMSKKKTDSILVADGTQTFGAYLRNGSILNRKEQSYTDKCMFGTSTGGVSICFE